jgi:hypothetical protein
VHCLFLKEAHQTVTETRGEQVSKEVEVPEHTLGQDYPSSDENARLFKLNEHKQVSSLVFCFF